MRSGVDRTYATKQADNHTIDELVTKESPMALLLSIIIPACKIDDPICRLPDMQPEFRTIRRRKHTLFGGSIT